MHARAHCARGCARRAGGLPCRNAPVSSRPKPRVVCQRHLPVSWLMMRARLIQLPENPRRPWQRTMGPPRAASSFSLLVRCVCSGTGGNLSQEKLGELSCLECDLCDRRMSLMDNGSIVTYDVTSMPCVSVWCTERAPVLSWGQVVSCRHEYLWSRYLRYTCPNCAARRRIVTVRWNRW